MLGSGQQGIFEAKVKAGARWFEQSLSVFQQIMFDSELLLQLFDFDGEQF